MLFLCGIWTAIYKRQACFFREEEASNKEFTYLLQDIQSLPRRIASRGDFVYVHFIVIGAKCHHCIHLFMEAKTEIRMFLARVRARNGDLNANANEKERNRNRGSMVGGGGVLLLT